MAILGAHESMAGGYYRAVEIAKRVGCECVQLFTKAHPSWERC
jgi:deoxyribonuclease-4